MKPLECGTSPFNVFPDTDNKTTQKDTDLPPFSEWLQICDSSVWTDQDHVATVPDVECGGKQNIT